MGLFSKDATSPSPTLSREPVMPFPRKSLSETAAAVRDEVDQLETDLDYYKRRTDQLERDLALTMDQRDQALRDFDYASERRAIVEDELARLKERGAIALKLIAEAFVPGIAEPKPQPQPKPQPASDYVEASAHKINGTMGNAKKIEIVTPPPEFRTWPNSKKRQFWMEHVGFVPPNYKHARAVPSMLHHPSSVHTPEDAGERPIDRALDDVHLHMQKLSESESKKEPYGPGDPAETQGT